MVKRIILCVFFVISQHLILAATAEAYTYYASPGGSGSSCSFSSPCALNATLGILSPGDTLYLRGGTYYQTVRFQRSGSANSRITISGYENETAVIDGMDTLPAGSYNFLVVSSGSYVTWKNLTIQNSYCAGFALKGNYSEAVNLKILNNGETGLVAQGDHNLIDSCTATGNGHAYNKGRGWGTWGSALCTNTTNTTIQNSLSYENFGEGFNSYGGARGSVIQDNVSYNNQSVNIYIDSATDTLVQRNMVYSTADSPLHITYGITIGQETGTVSNLTLINNMVLGCFVNLHVDSNVGSLNYVVIANNTFVNARKTQSNLNSGYNMNVYFRSNLKTFTESYFRNNIVLEQDPQQVPITLPSSHPGFTFSNNLWSKQPASAASGTGDVVADPKLLGSGDVQRGKLQAVYFMIASDSPARDRGVSISQVTDDYFGTARPVNRAPDIGACEYVGEQRTLQPPAGVHIVG